MSLNTRSLDTRSSKQNTMQTVHNDQDTAETVQTTAASALPKNRTLKPQAKSSLQKAWEKAQEDYLKENPKNPLVSREEKNKGDILQNWRRKYEDQDPESTKKKEKMVGILNNVLNGIELVGAFAAQAASTAFPPAGMCFNAVQFLIAAPRDIQKVYDDVKELFERVEKFLVQFRIYKRIDDEFGLDEDLVIQTNYLLICFVKICSTATHLLSGSRLTALKTGFKVVLFRDDGGVNGHLKEFQQLTEDQHKLTGTVSLEHILQTQESVDQVLRDTGALGSKMDILLAASNDKKTRLVNKERLSTIERKLFKEPLFDQNWTFTGATDELLPDTFDVIQRNQGYKSWLAEFESTPTTLIVDGAPGSGKSYLLDAVKKHLDSVRDDAEREDASIYVAGYSFAKKHLQTTPKTRVSQLSLPHALKILAFQVAGQSTTYAKGLHQRLSAHDDLQAEDDVIKLWSALRLSEFTVSKPSTLYILLDSIEQEFTKVQTLLDLIKATPQSSESPNTKIILAINNEDQAIDQLSKKSAYTLSADETKNELIESFVRQHMLQLDIFQGFDKRTRRQRQEVIDMLIPPNKDMVSFGTLRDKLYKLQDAIKNGLPRKNIPDILASGESKNRGILRDLESSLIENDVTLLRNILQWCVVQEGTTTLPMLEAALILGQVELPIEQLSKKINHEFASVLSLADDEVYLLPEIRDDLSGSWWPKNDERSNQRQSDGSLITLNISIQNATGTTMKNFVGYLHESMISGKFNLDEIQGQRANELSSDRVTDRLRILELCFMLVNEGWDDETKLLLPYACDAIPQLLAELRDDEPLLKSHERKMVGEGLVEFLTDPKCFKENSESHGEGKWLRYGSWIRAMNFWLKTKGVQEELSVEARRWASENTSEQSAPFDFLKDLAISIGGRWLTDTQSRSYELWVWINIYLEVTAENENFQQDEKPSNIEEDSTDSVTRARLWVAKHCLIDTVSSEAHLAIGNTCYKLEQYERAIKHFQEAVSEPKTKPHALQGLGLCYWSLGKTKVAGDNARRSLVTLFDMKDEGSLDDYDRESLINYLQCWGDHMAETGRIPEAIELYKERLDCGVDDLQAGWILLKLHCLTEGSQESAVRLLKNWTYDSRRFGRHSPASSLLELAEHDTYKTILQPLVASVRDETLRAEVLLVIADAIQLAGKTLFNHVHSRLYYLSGCCWKTGSTPEHTAQAIYFWEKALDTARSELVGHMKLYSILRNASRDVLKYKFETLRVKLDSNPDWSQSDKREMSKELQECYSRTMESCKILGDMRGVDGLQSLAIAFAQLCGDHDSVLKLCRGDMARCLSILSDSDPDNDNDGFKLLARIFCRLGDKINALTAFSLLDKKIFQKKFKDPTYSPTSDEQFFAGYYNQCSGCNKNIYSSDPEGIWWCQFCPNLDLCPACKDIHAAGSPGLKVREFAVGVHGLELCEPAHVTNFMHMVHFRHDEEEIPTDRVRVEWQFDQRGDREGGEVVTVEEWIRRVRVSWKIRKPIGDASRAQK